MEARALIPLALALASCAGPGAPDGHLHREMTKHHRFDDVDKWSRIFDDPARAAWQKPDLVVGALGLSAGEVVADIGAGTGYFSMRLARAVARGKVLAVDVEPNMVAFITERAAKEGLGNIVSILGAPEDPKLPERPTAVLIVDTAHHIDNRPAYFTKVREQSQPGARVVIVEFHADRELPVGPPPAMRIAHEQLSADLRAAGWHEVSIDLDALPYQYIATYRAP